MKKNFNLLTGILFLVTILVAGGCKKSANSRDRTPDPEKVIIYLSAVQINGEEHLELSDSTGIAVIDSLITGVDRGTTVLWKLKSSGRIKKIDSIYPSEKEPIILLKNPSKKFLSKTFKLVVPASAKEGKEKYAIKYILDNDAENTIDPYIRIPD